MLDIPGVPAPHYTCDTIDSFVDTLRRLLDAAWGPGWGEFTEETSVLNDPEQVALPYIVFHLESRVPNKELTPLKRKFHGAVADPHFEGYNIEVWRKWYDCKIRFYCFARTNREARYWANKLEAFIDTYVGYFKENGLSELLFLGENEPERTRMAGGLLPVRSLDYLARIEEIHVARHKVIEEIAINVLNPQTL